MASFITVKLVGGDDTIKYLKRVNERIKSDIEDEASTLMSSTKKVMRKKAPSDKGIYRRSIVSKNLAKDKSEINFIVGANKPHYRLTHLLEHGHRVVNGGGFTGKYTRKFPHVKDAQDYADEQVLTYFEKAIEKSFRKGE